MPERVSVILLNWNGADDTIACVESLLRLEQRDIGIYICDNQSRDNSIARLRGWAKTSFDPVDATSTSNGELGVVFRDLSDRPLRAPETLNTEPVPRRHVTLIQTGANIGYAAGNNVGLRFALAEGYSYFWILNNDTEVEPDALSSLVDRMRDDPSIGMCGSTLVYFDRRDMVQNLSGGTFSSLKGYGKGLGFGANPADPVNIPEVERQLAFVSGASMLVSRAFLERVGLMAEDYFLYYEELDWAFRAKREFRLGYAPRSVVYHKVGASIGTNDFGEGSGLSAYYLTRNRLKFCARHSQISLPFVFLDIWRKIASKLFTGQWQRAGLLFRALVGIPYTV